jgi:hypothetical protein
MKTKITGNSLVERLASVPITDLPSVVPAAARTVVGKGLRLTNQIQVTAAAGVLMAAMIGTDPINKSDLQESDALACCERKR